MRLLTERKKQLSASKTQVDSKKKTPEKLGHFCSISSRSTVGVMQRLALYYGLNIKRKN